MGALPLTDTAGLQVALKEGYFTQAGLNVTVKAVTQSTAAIPDLLHGWVMVTPFQFLGGLLGLGGLAFLRRRSRIMAEESGHGGHESVG